MYGLLIELDHGNQSPAIPAAWLDRIKEIDFFDNGAVGAVRCECAEFTLLSITKEKRYFGRLWYEGHELTGRAYRRAIRQGIYRREEVYTSVPVRLCRGTPEANIRAIQKSADTLMADVLSHINWR